MPRYNPDFTKVRLFPEAPREIQAPWDHLWHRQAEAIRADPRNSGWLTAAQIAAIIRRRVQEGM